MFEPTNLVRGAFLLLVVAACYFIPDHVVLFRTHAVPLTFIDRWVELDPKWIWFYVSYYPLLIVAFFLTTGHAAQKVYYESMILSALVGLFVFWLFPTEVPRDIYAWHGTFDRSADLLEYIRRADRNVNCAPSMHVGMSFLAAAAISLVTKWRGRTVVWALFLAICFSTMAVKQHYFVDLVAGLGLGLVTFAIMLRRHGLLLKPAERILQTT